MLKSEARPDDSARVLVCDAKEKAGALLLRHPPWGGEPWYARLECCDNPLCSCSEVAFFCARQDNPSRVLHFALDTDERKPSQNVLKKRDPDSDAFAEAVLRELGNQDWQALREFLLARQEKAIDAMDVNQLPPPPASSIVPEPGLLAAFVDVFPRAPGFDFTLDEHHWVVVDEYPLRGLQGGIHVWS